LCWFTFKSQVEASHNKNALVLITLSISIKLLANFFFLNFRSVSPEEYPHEWPAYDYMSKPYMELNAHNVYIGNRYHEETCNLYEALIDYLSR